MRRVWYAQIISLFGDWLALFAVMAVVSFGMLGTPRQIIGVQIAYMLPIVFVGPIAGVFVDRWPLKRTLVPCDLIRAVLALMLIGTVMIARPPAATTTDSKSNRIHVIWRDMRQGMSFIVHHAAVLFVVLAMAAGLFVIGCFGPLIAIYVRDTLRGSAQLFGYV